MMAIPAAQTPECLGGMVIIPILLVLRQIRFPNEPPIRVRIYYRFKNNIRQSLWKARSEAHGYMRNLFAWGDEKTGRRLCAHAKDDRDMIG